MVVMEKMLSLSHTVYRPEDSDNDTGLFALLDCPNGSGVVRMLTDHCNRSDHKISTIVLCYFTISFTNPKKEIINTYSFISTAFLI